MKIPFDITKRPQIESGDYKVFAHEHEEQEARIVCWDNKGEYPIVALVDNEPEKFDKHGRVPGGNRGGEFSLFLVTPEEEPSEFEQMIENLLNMADGEGHARTTIENTKRVASELLALAREQFIKDGYVIEKEAFHDAVEKVEPEVKKEVSANLDLANFVHDLGERYPEVSFTKLTRIAKAAYDYGRKELKPEIDAEIARAYMNADEVMYRRGKEEALKEIIKSLFPLETDIETLEDLHTAIQENGIGCYKHGFEEGKKVALKDMPRWKKSVRNKHTLSNMLIHSTDKTWIGREIKEGQYYVSIDNLIVNLPGFKDE